ncbi:hypothetical protein FBU30_007960 [Linnemannia zychae]|nr:hypothetical protein FBU30_007960 [Linnemannia zychae]
MCILLWTLPSSNHPRFKFVLASNRDEYLGRATSRADFWDLDPVLAKSISLINPLASSDNILTPASDSTSTLPYQSPVGIVTGQDLQPSLAINYTIQEYLSFSSPDDSQQEQATLSLDTSDIPGTWLGMTTHGDFVGLTNFRETAAYMASKRDPKLSRGKVCGEFLVTMAAAHHKNLEEKANLMENRVETIGLDQDPANPADDLDTLFKDTLKKTTKKSIMKNDQAEKWFRKRAVGWENEFEGLNLLVVQNAGDQQCIGGNRLGSEITVFTKPDDFSLVGESRKIQEGSVVGVSNSVFTQPWTKVKNGVAALESVLNQSLALFGIGSNASYSEPQSEHRQASATTPTTSVDDDSREIAWLVIQMLTFLRMAQPFSPEDSSDASKLLNGLCERIFIPRIDLGGPTMEYGTRSSTITLFGREQGGIAVLVEKVWYSEKDPETGERIEYAPDSSEGLIWWQGRVGQPRDQWRQVVGNELDGLLKYARTLRQV